MVSGQHLLRHQKALIRSLRKEGRSVKNVIKFCGERYEDPFKVCRQTVTKVCSYATLDEACQGPGHTKKFRGFRSPFLSENPESRIQRRIRSNLRSEDKGGDELKAATVGNAVSRASFFRFLRKGVKGIRNNLHTERRDQKKLRELTPEQKEKRVTKCKELLVRIQKPRSVVNPINRKKVAFADEKFFTLDGPTKGRGWRLTDKPEREQRRYGGRSLLVWFCLTAQSLTSFIWPCGKTVDGEEYGRTIDSEFPRSEADFLYDDNWSVHRTDDVQDAIISQHVNALDTPPNSADLNLTEKVNGDISNRVYRNGKQYTSIPVLRKAIRDAVQEFNNSGTAARWHDRLSQKWVMRMQRVVQTGGKRLGDRWNEQIG